MARALTLVYFSTDSITCPVLVSDLFPVSVSACLMLTPRLHPGGSARARLGANTDVFSFSCYRSKVPLCALCLCVPVCLCGGVHAHCPCLQSPEDSLGAVLQVSPTCFISVCLETRAIIGLGLADLAKSDSQ